MVQSVSKATVFCSLFDARVLKNLYSFASPDPLRMVPKRSFKSDRACPFSRPLGGVVVADSSFS
jgi:hypothetical protein